MIVHENLNEYFQPYRHVDNIMFENGNMVNRFLEYWRMYGHQRIGFLYGRYDVYDGVPLGIRATVAAIYEPPQVVYSFPFHHCANSFFLLANIEG